VSDTKFYYMVRCTAVAVRDQDLKASESDYVKLETLKIELERTMEEKQAIEKRLHSMNEALSGANVEYVSQVIALDAEINDLKAALHDAAAKEYGSEEDDDESELDEMLDGASGEEDAPTVEQLASRMSRSQRRSLKKDCKLLWRWIAMRCHPDKTQDTSKHQLFHQARIYYDELCLEGLQRIKNTIEGIPSGLMSSLLLEIKELEHVVQQAKAQLVELQNSYDYEILSLFEVNPRAVKMHYSASLVNKISSLHAELKFLRSRLAEVKGETDVAQFL
jgi:hypothetical protein